MDDRVDQAMHVIRRRWFLPAKHRLAAGSNRPIPIGYGATNSQPQTVANMLRLLDVQPGSRILDVGAGSGWTTALLAHLTGRGGDVVGVELTPELAVWGARNLARLRLPHARIEDARTGVLGWPDGAPYDRILVSASAKELPDELVDQLAIGGVMVIVVVGRMLRLRKDATGSVWTTDHGAYLFVPLR